MNEYYIYVYMDPRKPGQYNYDGFKLEYEPFYFQSKIENNFGQYLTLMDKEIKSEKDNKIYKNILHVIHDNKNVKINNLLSLIKSKKIFKYNEHKSSKKLF